MAIDIEELRKHHQKLSSKSSTWQYDGKAKSILRNRQVLAYILKSVIKGLQDKPLDEIASLIEDDIEVGTPIEPGLSNKVPSRDINGLNTENDIDGEGKITYDIKFYARLAENFQSQVIINVEAQKRSSMPYPLMNRAVFYAARLISAQKEVEFHKDEYEKIKPVYTIWLCMNRPEDSLSYSTIEQTSCYGECGWTGSAESLINIVFVGLKNLENSELVEAPTEMHIVLDTIFSNKLTEKERNAILTEYNIELPDNVKEDAAMIDGLGQSIYEEGLEKGIEQGIEQGSEQAESMLEKNMDLQLIIDCTGLSEQQVLELKDRQSYQ